MAKTEEVIYYLMAKITYGKRIGQQGQLGVGCSAFILDPTNSKVLLIKRVDDGRWAVPGGYMESGESLHEACEREVWEETGVRVKATHLVAVYSDPNILLEYPDGNKWQIVVLHFVADKVGGNLVSGDETTDVGYFSLDEISKMNIGEFDRQRINDGFTFKQSTVVRDDFGWR